MTWIRSGVSGKGKEILGFEKRKDLRGVKSLRFFCFLCSSSSPLACDKRILKSNHAFRRPYVPLRIAFRLRRLVSQPCSMVRRAASKALFVECIRVTRVHLDSVPSLTPEFIVNCHHRLALSSFLFPPNFQHLCGVFDVLFHPSRSRIDRVIGILHFEAFFEVFSSDRHHTTNQRWGTSSSFLSRSTFRSFDSPVDLPAVPSFHLLLLVSPPSGERKSHHAHRSRGCSCDRPLRCRAPRAPATISRIAVL